MRRALAILAALALSACAVIPTEHGRAVLVGDVAFATGSGGDCTLGDHRRESDYGREAGNIGKHETRTRSVAGGSVCYEGSGITDNLRAAIAFVVGLLL